LITIKIKTISSTLKL